jgi:hypothetical protein
MFDIVGLEFVKLMGHFALKGLPLAGHSVLLFEVTVGLDHESLPTRICGSDCVYCEVGVRRRARPPTPSAQAEYPGYIVLVVLIPQ